MRLARDHRPDIVFCDYDVLASAPVQAWESDPVLVRIPIVAVSLTRRGEEAHSPDGTGDAGVLYLPTLSEQAARRIMQTASVAASVVRAPAGALRFADGVTEMRAE